MHTKSLTTVVEQLAELFTQTKQQLTVAESCTGGWVAKVLTDLAGSSVWFERGFVTYSNRSKHEMLGVAESTLKTYGAVSQETVEEMALGALQNSHANFSVSISGIAGPGGGSADKPVGLVWFAWAHKTEIDEQVIASEQKNFNGDRDAIRQQAVVYALSELLNLISK
ncbi:MAG: nicotinamide-nucleotide amidase [Gammaproteobacteria bacterium]|nr:nicotinamide-nucleotide amidase [Gammaproteobacteria bacterium]